jgi:hypothetical protein
MFLIMQEKREKFGKKFQVQADPPQFPLLPPIAVNLMDSENGSNGGLVKAIGFL